MGVQVIGADLTVPPGTPQAAPVTLVVPITSGWVGRATLTIPRGPNGLAGWALQLAGSPLIPYLGESWIIADDYTFPWDIERWVNTGQLVCLGYNTGVYPHTFRFRCELSPTEPAIPVAASLAAQSSETAGTELAVSGITGFSSDVQEADLVAAGG